MLNLSGAGRHRPAFAALSVRRKVLVAASILMVGCSHVALAADMAPQAQAPRVGVQVLHPENVVIEANLTGRVEAATVSEIRPQVEGIVRERLFTEGALVKQGEVLYRIDASAYQAKYDQAAAALAVAEAALPSAASKAARYKALSGGDAVSKQDAEAADAALLQAVAQVNAAKAALASAKIDLEHAEVRAPISGRIGKSSVTEGALVTTAQASPLAVIRAEGEVNVDLVMSAGELAKLRKDIAEGLVKQEATSAVSIILDDGSAYAHRGVVAFSEQTVDQSTGTYTLRAKFPNPDGILMPGMFVRASVEQGVAQGVFRLPQRTVSHNAKGAATVLLVGADGTVEDRTIAVIRNSGNDWIVRAIPAGCSSASEGAPPHDCSGVAAGEQVVVEGSQNAKAGTKVSFYNVQVGEDGKAQQLPSGTSAKAGK